MAQIKLQASFSVLAEAVQEERLSLEDKLVLRAGVYSNRGAHWCTGK